MKFEDLTLFDLNLLKGNAIYSLIHTNMSRFEALAEATLSCIYAKGYKLSPYPDKLSLVIAKAIECSGTQQPSAEDLVKKIFEFIEQQKIGISKDDAREATWTQPRECWYTPYVPYKKPWMF